MKQLAMSLLGTLFGLGIALFIYDHFVVQPREASRIETSSVEFSRAADQARNITDSMDASVQQSIDKAQQAFDAQAADQNKRRLATDALAQTQMYKVAITESYMTNGKWPAQASEAGLPGSNAKPGGSIRNIVVGELGTIIVSFDHNFADSARLQWIPQADAESYQVRWQCRTSGDPDLTRYLPGCSND
ncbi:MAG: pilin [Pseudoxanthomonas sp.]